MVLVLLIFGFGYLTLSDRRGTSSAVQYSLALQAADGASERARIALLDRFENSIFTSQTYLARVRDGLEFNGINSGEVDGVPVRWEVREVSAAGSRFGWVDVAATAEAATGVQTVVRRVSFGQQPPVFHLAMLSERTDCMYCHLRVRGDVGSFHHLRPGWGAEFDPLTQPNWHDWSVNSGEGSRIDGNVFAAADVTTHGSPGTLNGATVTGTVQEEYRGPELSIRVDANGVPQFPPLSREVAAANATGTLTGGALRISVGPTGSLSSLPENSGMGSVDGTHEGNLILIGTETDPIEIDGDIYASGDIIIKGFVKGVGGIYAGRNVYIAGDLITLNSPVRCFELPLAERDDCAENEIANGKDAVRIAARGNIVLGDYTEYVSGTSGDLLPRHRRQAADFMREQFYLEHDAPHRHFHKTNGDELRFVDDDNTGFYVNVDGTVIPSSEVTTVDAHQAYDYALRPGRVNATGVFESWLPDDLYRQILGSSYRTHNSFRWNGFSTATSDELIAEMTPLGLSADAIDGILAQRVYQPDGTYSVHGNISESNGPALGYFQMTDFTIEGNRTDELKVVWDGALNLVNQTRHVDAFLYSNMRIGGRTAMDALVINGGLISKEIGILAPGRRKADWMAHGRYNALDAPGQCPLKYDRITSFQYADGCRLTVNYDYRLRNGGYGFNLIIGEAGATVGWRVADRYDERVAAAP